MSQPSWRLKVARAEKHLSELDRLLSQYIDGHHYRAVGIVPSKGYSTKWRFVLKVTQEPDYWLSVVLGDFLFDARSALDHIAVAVAPKKYKYDVAFPICTDRAPASVTGCKESETFRRLTRGMSPEAIAIIDWEQPYNLRARGLVEERPGSLDTLSVLSTLQNADKHRGLNLLTTSISWPRVTVERHGQATSITTPTHCEPGAQLISSTEFPSPYDEVQVNVVGTPHVAVKVRALGPYEVSGEGGIGRGILKRVDRILSAMEPHVI